MNLVRVMDLFEVKYGVNLDLNKLEEVSVDAEGAIPYVGRSEKQNGVTAFVEKLESVPPNPAMTISVAGGGSVMSSFLHEIPYYSGRDLFYLKPKVPMSKQILLYYCTALTMNKFKFSYGRQVNKTLKSLRIPDISEIPQRILDYEIDDTKGINDFQALNTKVNNIGAVVKNQNEDNFMRLDKIFDVFTGLASSNVLVQPEKVSDDLIPYVRPSKWQSTSYAGFVDTNTVPANKVFPAETLYVSTDGAGSHTYSYLSVETFVPNSNVVVLIPKEDLTLEEKLAYAALITANRFKFSYGRKPKGEKLKSLLLPVID